MNTRLTDDFIDALAERRSVMRRSSLLIPGAH
jgi:hypothetical protein